MNNEFENAKREYQDAKETGHYNPEDCLDFYLTHRKITETEAREIRTLFGDDPNPNKKPVQAMELPKKGKSMPATPVVNSAPKNLSPKKNIVLKGLKALPPKKYIVKRFEIEEGTITGLCASGSSGKSFFLQYLACCVSSGKPFFDKFDVKQGKVLHLDQEQSEIQTQRRYERLAGWLELKELDIDRVVLENKINLSNIKSIRAELEEAFAGYTLVLIDSLKAISSIDENSADIEEVPKMLKRISEKLGFAVVLIHHKGKSSDNTKQSGRGHSSIYDSFDNQFDLEHGIDSTDYEITCKKVRDAKLADGINYTIIDDGPFNEEQNCMEMVKFQLLNDEVKPVKKEHKNLILKCLQDKSVKNQSEIFKEVKGDRNTFNKTLKQLTEEGLISEHAERGPKGAKLFEITEEGISFLGWDSVLKDGDEK